MTPRAPLRRIWRGAPAFTEDSEHARTLPDWTGSMHRRTRRRASGERAPANHLRDGTGRVALVPELRRARRRRDALPATAAPRSAGGARRHQTESAGTARQDDDARRPARRGTRTPA